MKTATIDAQTLGDPNLSAARALLRAAGHDDDAIDRAFYALQERDRCVEASSDNLLSAREVCDWLGITLSTLCGRKSGVWSKTIVEAGIV